MRPHTELIDSADLFTHHTPLDGAAEPVAVRRLSVDEEDGSCTAVVDFEHDWSRPAGYQVADVEWFVLAGAVDVGESRLTAGGYWRAAAGLAMPPVAVAAGSRVLVLRDGPAGFVASERNRTAFVPQGRSTQSGHPALPVVVGADAATSWAPNPYAGECTAHRALDAVTLYQDPFPDWEQPRGPQTVLYRFPAGWRFDLYEHHAVAEEWYVVSGSAEYNFGRLAPGRYAYRPPLVKHGEWVVDDEPLVLLVRSAGPPTHWLTRDPTFVLHGDPINYDGNDPATATIPVGLPVRSARAGVFDSPIR